MYYSINGLIVLQQQPRYNFNIAASISFKFKLSTASINMQAEKQEFYLNYGK